MFGQAESLLDLEIENLKDSISWKPPCLGLNQKREAGRVKVELASLD